MSCRKQPATRRVRNAGMDFLAQLVLQQLCFFVASLFDCRFQVESVEVDDALPHGLDGGLGAVGHAELVEDAGEVGLDAFLTEGERAGDFLVAQAVDEVVQDFEFARGEILAVEPLELPRGSAAMCWGRWMR